MTNSSNNIYDNFRIQNGLISLLIFDEYLLVNNLSERAITHKLAEHYQRLFHEWNVDCEYNRNLGGPKIISINPRKILDTMANKLESNGYKLNLDLTHEYNSDSMKEQMHDLARQLRDPNRLEYREEIGVAWFTLTLLTGKKVIKTIFPDIIIHKRGTKNNHAVIEVKKTNHDDVKDKAYDLYKLIALVSSPEYRYKKGYFINIPVLNKVYQLKKFSSPKLFIKDVYKIEPEYTI